MRGTFARVLCELAESDERVFLLTPDMGYSVLEGFAERFPGRFINTGIAEQNTVSVAAGLALCGRIVYVYSIIPFVTMRCYEQVRLDLAYNGARVRLVGIGAGLTYGSLGPSHHAYEDIALMRAVPGMRVLCPGDPFEVEQLMRQCHESDGPAYMRLGKNGEPRVHPDGARIRPGTAARVRSGSDLAIITTSNMLEQGAQWAERWKKEGIGAALYSMHTMKPFDERLVERLVRDGVPVVTLEEHSAVGGLGSCVAEAAARTGLPARIKSVSLRDEFSHLVGGHEYQRREAGLLEPPDLGGLGLR